MATTFSVPKADGSVAYVYIDAIQATPDNITFAGDIDGYAITGRAERTDDQVNVIIVPQVFGVGMAKKRVAFLIRKHSPRLIAGGTAGVTMANLQTQPQGQPPANAEDGSNIAINDGPPKNGIPSNVAELELTPVASVDCVCCGGTPAGNDFCNEDDSINCGMKNPCAGGGTCKWMAPSDGGSWFHPILGVGLILIVSLLGERKCSRRRSGKAFVAGR